jgi:enoyl-CoA hydratase/carnithine racemase
VEKLETIRYEVADDNAIITLNRPNKRNALTVTMFGELGTALEAASQADDVRGVLIAGEGVSFCAGIDLTTLMELAGVGGSRFRSFVLLAQRPYRALAQMEKPAIAAVQGDALGAGFQLALACDLRVVAADVRFGMLEPRFGIIPDLGGAHHLTRLVGLARAKELVWSTRMVEAEEAERIGLANRVVPRDQLETASRELLGNVTQHSPVVVAQVKSLIDRASETPLELEFDRELTAQGICIESEDHKEAVAAIAEERPPRYSGR